MGSMEIIKPVVDEEFVKQIDEVIEEIIRDNYFDRVYTLSEEEYHLSELFEEYIKNKILKYQKTYFPNILPSLLDFDTETIEKYLRYKALLETGLNNVKFDFSQEGHNEFRDKAIKTGLLKENDKFCHNMFAQYYAFKVLTEEFMNEDIAKIIINIIFLRPEYYLIRLFIDDFLSEQYISNEVYKMYGELLLKLNKAERTKVHKKSSWEEDFDEILYFLQRSMRELNHMGEE